MANLFVFMCVTSLLIFVSDVRSDRIEFFKDEWAKIRHRAKIKIVTLEEPITFEITDDDEVDTVSNWPINCWVSSNNSGILQHHKLFVKNGCQFIPGVSIINGKPTDEIRVSFSLFPIFRQLNKYLYVQCQYVKCSSWSHETYAECPTEEHCLVDTPPVLFDEKRLLLAKSDTVLVTRRSTAPSTIPIAPVPDKRPTESFEKHNIPTYKNEISEEQCDCSQKLKECRSIEKSENDDRDANVQHSTNVQHSKLSLAIVAGISFSSFFVGLILMGAICWIEKRHQPVPQRKRTNVRTNTVKYPILPLQIISDTPLPSTSAGVSNVVTFKSVKK